MYVERVIGSIRRDCLDHVVVMNEKHVRRILTDYFAYYHRSRTHLSPAMDCPEPRPALGVHPQFSSTQQGQALPAYSLA